MNILYHLASFFVRNLKDCYEKRLSSSIDDITDEFSHGISFKTVDEERIVIEKWDAPNLTFRVTINNKSYGKKNYPLDRFLIKNIYNDLKNEINNNS